MTYQEWLAANPAHAANAVPGSALSMQAYQEAMSPPPAPEANMSPVMRPGPPVSQPLSTAPAPEAPPGAPPPPPAPEGPGVLGQAVLGARGAAAGLLRSPAGNLLAPAGLARRAADAIAPPETAKPGPAPEEGTDVTPAPPEPPPMPSWFAPEEKKGGGGGGMVAMGPIGARNITQQAGHPISQETTDLLKKSGEAEERSQTFAKAAFENEEKNRSQAQYEATVLQARQAAKEWQFEQHQKEARAAFEQRVEDRAQRARDEAPRRSVGTLFSAIGAAFGAWGSAITKTPNAALEIYKMAEDEEARRQERESKDENNYYSRMLQEFGDRKQALAMTKIGYLEQARAAFEKASATAKTEQGKAALEHGASLSLQRRAALVQEMVDRAGGERTEQTTLQIYPGQVDAQGNGPPGIRIEGPGRPVAPSASAAPAAPKEPEKRDDSAWGRLSGLWKERQAEAEKAAAVGAGIRGAVGGLGDRIGSFINGDPEAARAAPAPAVQVAPPSVKSIARAGAQLTEHVPGSTLAPDGRPPMTFKEHEAAVKKIDTLNEKHKDLIEARAAAQAFESAWSAVDPAAWKLFDPKKAAAYREAYKAASLVESKGNFLSRAAAGYVGSKSKAEIDAELAREPDAFRKMFIAHNTMHQARLLLLSGKAVTNSEIGTDNLTMFSSDIPVLMMQAYKTGIRGPLDTKWNGATSTWGEPEHRMWRYSQRPTFMKALGDTQAMERGVKETKVGAP